MLKLTNLLPAIVSVLILGTAISFSTQFFTDNEVFYNYSDLPAHCDQDTTGSTECIPLMESEAQGFPIRYQATFFDYRETTQEEGVPMTEVHTDNMFYWADFIINSLIWSGIALVLIAALVRLINFFSKTNKKLRK